MDRFRLGPDVGPTQPVGSSAAFPWHSERRFTSAPAVSVGPEWHRGLLRSAALAGWDFLELHVQEGGLGPSRPHPTHPAGKAATAAAALNGHKSFHRENGFSCSMGRSLVSTED